MANVSLSQSNVVELSSDQTWARMRIEAASAAAQEPTLASFLHETVLNHETYTAALSYRIAQKLSDAEMSAMQWREVCSQAFADEPHLVEAALHDLRAVYSRDPACNEFMQPFLYFKGYLALQTQRNANWLWRHDRRTLALYLQSRMSELFAVDIHPATIIGKGVFIDHATGIVIGETAVVEDDVSILQNVTLGGTGKEDGDRHPKIRRGALSALVQKFSATLKSARAQKLQPAASS